MNLPLSIPIGSRRVFTPSIWMTALSALAIVGSLGPVLTLLLAWALLGEPVSALQLAGALLVIAGVWLVGRRREAA